MTARDAILILTLIFTHIFSTSVVLVLNKMVLVLVIESLVAIEQEHEHRRPTEHEHEFTNKSVNSLEPRADMWVKDEDAIIIIAQVFEHTGRSGMIHRPNIEDMLNCVSSWRDEIR